MGKLNIVYKNIRDLHPYKKNAKKHNKEQVEQIANSIKEFGFTQPVVVDKDNNVVAGHGRILGAKKAGLKQIPTVMLSDLTEQQINAYRLVDNKLNESDWNMELLDDELSVLEADIDMSLFGFELSDDEEKEQEEKKVEFTVREKYEVHIICKDKQQMEQVFERVKGYGEDCKTISTV